MKERLIVLVLVLMQIALATAIVAVFYRLLDGAWSWPDPMAVLATLVGGTMMDITRINRARRWL